MSLKSKILTGVNKTLRKLNLQLLKLSTIESTNSIDPRYIESTSNHSNFPIELESALRDDNEKLLELKEKYHEFNCPATTHSLWSDKNLKGNEFDMRNFRGDNLFLWQYRSVGSSAHLKYLLYSYYIQRIDTLNLLEKLDEDDLFGVYLFDVNGKYKVSRDLLDSISEIYFMEKYLKISEKRNLKILDIGAGYGRLAYRLTEVFGDNIESYNCVDAIAASTYLCDFYLRFRGVDKKAKSIPLFEIESFLDNNKVDLAINIHSFSECTLSSIQWWIDLLSKNKVKYFILIPNPRDEKVLLSTETDGSSLDYSQYLKNAGYELSILEPKFLDSSLQKLIHHHPVYYYLFEFVGSNY